MMRELVDSSINRAQDKPSLGVEHAYRMRSNINKVRFNGQSESVFRKVAFHVTRLAICLW